MAPALDHACEGLIMLSCGMFLSAVYTGLVFFRGIFLPGGRMSFLQDLLFWLFAGLTACAFFYRSSYGALSLHAFLLLGLGAYLWKVFFHGKILSAFSRICGTMGKSLHSDKGVCGEHDKKRKRTRKYGKPGTRGRYRL